jgi:DNA-binding PadR family transcriptional regulator
MSTLSSGDLTPRMMVLGLVVQQPDSVAGVARRLTDQFASARFPKTSAHTNLPSLAAKGYVRLLEHGRKPSLSRYEATPAGVAHLHQWLLSSVRPPMIRDAVQCKLELLEREDLTALIGVIRGEEEACRQACNSAHGRVVGEQSSRRARSAHVDWRVRLRAIQSKDEAALWGMMSQRLEHLREALEELEQDIAVADSVRPVGDAIRPAAGSSRRAGGWDSSVRDG